LFVANALYKEDIAALAYSNIRWDKLRDKSITITGATGLIGTFLVDLLMHRNFKYNDNITIYAVARNKEKALIRFEEYFTSPFFEFISKDIKTSFELDAPIDYIINGALNSHPIAYATEPVNTILTSILGINSMLDFASTHNVSRTLYLSSSEIYGINRGDVEAFKEDYCGYLDCNTVRSCYPEGKRAAESLCQAYIKEKNIDVMIARSCHVYGPTMGDDDSKVIAQFLRNAVNKENIVLKSKGDQLYSYLFVADICSALLFILLNGKNGEVYNISDNDSNLSLLEIANILSEYTGKDIVFDTPSTIESEGYSKANKRLLDSSKLIELGWKPMYTLKDGIIRTVKILQDMSNDNAVC